ncbi:MAG: hypothetical protein R3300_19095, partial [Candidatus Promineifilaceae bacterium]|nr:hypothetical protein [Candidatus Promineifilaceae bacterium]
TFYAKQAEYARLWQQPLHERFGQLLLFSVGGPPSGLQGISGARLVLLPGTLLAGARALWSDWSARRMVRSLPLLWAIGLVFLYAWRLPVTYHHGRYLWPALPIWIVYGLTGWQVLTSWILNHITTNQLTGYLWRRVTSLTFIALLAVFFVLGLQTYQRDVAFVNGEMVTAAKWLDANVAADALVAAHDIGALGYFAPQPILDLAGLISPEIVSLLADELAVASFVRESSADYLVTAPGWTYESLTQTSDATKVFSTDYDWTRQQGYNNMAIYRLAP